MSRAALEYLAKSILGSKQDREERFAALNDEQLKQELARYRAHVLGAELAVTKGLGVAVSAREGIRATENAIRRSVLYFDEVSLPDPIFALSEWSRDRQRMPWMKDTAPRDELVKAARYIEALSPLVSIGRVRFIPRTRLKYASGK